jgi:hypothetical protein
LPVSPLKELLKPNAETEFNRIFQRVDYCVVRNPGTYTFRYNYVNPNYTPGTHDYDHIKSTTVWTWVLIAFKATQPASYSKALGNIVHKESLDLTRKQCRANGLYGSLCMDSQKTASDWLKDLYVAMNAAPVWSGFQLKSIPYSEVSCIGNGVLYISSATSPGLIANLNTDDFIGDIGQPMVVIEVKASADCQNVIQIQHPNRVSNYEDISASMPDTGAVAQNGARPYEQVVLRCIQDDAIAQMLLGIMARRANVLDKVYKFKLNARWKLLEPMDIVTITDLLVGIDHLPVRLIKIDEDKNFDLDCEAEAYVWGLSSPRVVVPTTHMPNGTDVDAVPDSINTPIFAEATAALGNATQAQLWIIVSDGDEIYGGCQVYVSTDGGTSYSIIGVIIGNAPMGELAATWPSGTDPDTTNDLLVDLTESLSELISYAVTDEDAFAYPFLVEGASAAAYELGAYAVATLTSANKYTLSATSGNHLRRGILGSTIASHAAAKKFVFLDPTSKGILKVNLPSTWISQALKFKFAAANMFGGGLQALADCTVYEYTPSGVFVSSYQTTAEKGIANGYAGLGATGQVPSGQLGTGSPGTSTFLAGDGVWRSVIGSAAFSLDFNATTDWGAASGGYYTITANHNLNSENLVVSVWDTTNGQVQVLPDQINQVTADQLTFRVTELPDKRFAGKVVISGGIVSSATPSIVLSLAAQVASINLSTVGTLDFLTSNGTSANINPARAAGVAVAVHSKRKGGWLKESFEWFNSGTGSVTFGGGGPIGILISTTTDDDQSPALTNSNPGMSPLRGASGAEYLHYGFKFKVPASTILRTLRIGTAVNSVKLTFTASLSDGSMAPQSVDVDPGGASYLAKEITIIFNASVADAYLTVVADVTTNYSGSYPDVGFFYATLAET